MAEPVRIAKPDERREPLRVNFTKSFIAALRAPECGQRAVYDERVVGLCVLVTAGSKTFYLRRRIAGRPERVRIGSFPQTTVDQARAAAQRLNGQIASDRNPAEQRRAALAETTFGELFARYMDLHAKIHKRTWASDQATYDLHLTALGAQRVSRITRADVKGLHAKLGAEHGHYAANRTMALLSAVFGFGRKTLDLDVPNPAAGVQRFAEQSRERFLQADELRRLFAALDAEPNQDLADLVRLALATGARRGNLCAMRWDALNLDAMTWTIPGSEYKSRATVTLPLTADAVKLLRARREQVPADCEWVFPSWGGSGHLSEPKKGWDALRKRAGIPDVRLHDLRRTAGSWAAATGATSTMIGRALGHKAGSPVTAIYARLNLEPVRAAMQTASDAMRKAGKARPNRKGARHAKA